ncbi:hypothetical protein GCK32_018125, partial [Trichostrongylus colubriformis]
EPGFSEEQVNIYTELLCKFMNESKRIFLTPTEVDGNSLISVSINYDKTSEENVNNSWVVMKSLIEEFTKRKDDPYLLVDEEPHLGRRKSSFGRFVYDSVVNTPEHSPTKTNLRETIPDAE